MEKVRDSRKSLRCPVCGKFTNAETVGKHKAFLREHEVVFCENDALKRELREVKLALDEALKANSVLSIENSRLVGRGFFSRLFNK